MNIFNVASIIPLKKLKRENDIVIRVQDHLHQKYNFNFVLAKSLPYVSKLLSKKNSKWKEYYNYRIDGKIDVQGYHTYVYSWFMPPTSNFWINCIFLPFNWLYFSCVSAVNVQREAERADVILSQNVIPDSIVAYWCAKKYNKPYIINLRNDAHPKWFRLPLFRSVIQSANAIVTHSPTIYKRFLSDYNVNFVPHPVDSEFYSDTFKFEGVVKIVSVCRLLKLKNLDWVLRALLNLKNQGVIFEYSILGDGPELNRLMDLVEILDLSDEVTFMGYLDKSKVSKVMHDSQLFIMPSYPETLGRVFLEAAAAKCLIIGHKNTGVDGVFEHGESAFFVDSSSIQDNLEYAISIIGSIEHKEMVERSTNIVRAFSWDKVGSIYCQLFRSTLK